MIYDNEFNCPDGHKFRANAKLRARCPDCGKMSRRTYSDNKEENSSSSPPSVAGGDSSPETSPPNTLVEPERTITLLKKGKPRFMAKRTMPAKDEHGRFIKAGAKPKSTVKKTVSKTVAKKPAGIVRKHTVTATKITPKIVGRPKRTAVARHVAGGGGRRSYADEMMERYG